MKYSVIIVAYNAYGLLEACLESVRRSFEGRGDYEVIVVDNSPQDYPAGKLMMTHRYLRDGKNHGFAEGCNIGARMAKGEILIFLNPDTEVYGDWADQMAKYLEDDVGAVGPISNFVAGQQRVDFHMQQADTPEETAERAAEALYGRAVETKLIIGFCCMIRKEVYEKMGGMDPDLFLGNDDLDLSWRLRLAGYTLLIASDVFIYHAGHKSFETRPRPEVEKLLQESEDVLRTKLKTFYQGNPPSAVELWGVDFFNTQIRRPMTLSICMIVRGEEANLPILMPQIEWADEIVIVDTSKPPENFLLSIGTAKVHRFPWTDDFAEARNFALSKCTGDWILWLDADDRVPEESAKLIRAALTNPGPKTWNRKVFFEFLVQDMDEHGKVAKEFFQPRLFPNVNGMGWTGRIHESIIPRAQLLGIWPVRTTIKLQHTGYADEATRLRKADRNIRLLEMDEDSPFKFYNLGVSKAMVGRWDEAKQDFDHALTMEWPEPLWPPFASQLKVQCVKALIHLGRLDDLAPYLDGNLAPDSLYYAGFYWSHKGDRAKAIHFYREYLEKTQKMPDWPYEVDAPKNRAFAFAGMLNGIAEEHDAWKQAFETEYQAA